MGIIQRLKTEGVLKLYHDYRSGHLDDLSGNDNDGTPSETVWTNRGIEFPKTAEVAVSDSAELQLTEGTLIVLADFTSQEYTEVLIAKRDTGGINYQFQLVVDNIQFYDGTNIRSIATDITGKKCVTISFANGEIPTGYVDGVRVGSFDKTVAV